MFSSRALVLAVSLFLLSAQARDIRRSIPQQSVSRAIPFTDPSPLTAASNVLTLSRNGGPNTRNAAHVKGLAIGTGSSTNLTAHLNGENYDISVKVGNETLQVLADTGSSDFWVVESGFKCVDKTSKALRSATECNFGPAYRGKDSFVKIPGRNFNVTYPTAKEFMTGTMGYENVTLAGITVNQTMALVDIAAWNGDGKTSGIMGLAYPSLTSAFNGTNPELDDSQIGQQIIYNPILTNMFEHGLAAPLFSLAIERGPDGPSGYLAIGGTPPVDFVPNFTETPILVTNVKAWPKAFDFYTVGVEALALKGRTISNGTDPLPYGVQYIVDSGTSLNFLPPPYADAVNAAFDPPAKFSKDEGVYVAQCHAVPPDFGIVINGTTFFHNKVDLIVPAHSDSRRGCTSGITRGNDNGDDVFILGATFLKNVVAVFDVGAGLMKFASRINYTSVDTH